MIPAPRRAVASFVLTDANGAVVNSGEAEALIADDALIAGPLSISYLDADALHAHDYRVELELWPAGRLTLTQLGRRYDTFVAELRRMRNRARVAGMLAHGITMPETFQGGVVSPGEHQTAEIQVYDTHVTVIPGDGDPWQIPLGAIVGVGSLADPPGIVLQTTDGLTTLCQLARRRDACESAIVERREAQLRLLSDLTGQSGFSDGCAVPRNRIHAFNDLAKHFTARERSPMLSTLIATATGEPRFGFAQLLDPDGDRLETAVSIPPNWASFVLVPVGDLTVLEITAGPAAATYIFRAGIDAVSADLQRLHLRRAPLALTDAQATLTPDNPYRLALRRLQPLRRLRDAIVARVIHTSGWQSALEWTLVRASTGASETPAGS